MALDDYMEPEVAIAVAVTAAVASPPVRKVMRKGAVYGLAGLLMLGDRLSAMSRTIVQTAQQTAASMTHGATNGATEPQSAAEVAAG
jgi:hypothetical protein